MTKQPSGHLEKDLINLDNRSVSGDTCECNVLICEAELRTEDGDPPLSVSLDCPDKVIRKSAAEFSVRNSPASPCSV